MKRFALGLALLLYVGVGPATAGTIDLISEWDGTSYNHGIGVPDTATYGQTFTADNSLGLYLDSFSFLLQGDTFGGTTPTPFSTYVAAWDGTKTTGPILYKSEPENLPSDPSAPYAQFSFNTGGIQLVNGLQYVIFLSVAEYHTGNGQARMASRGQAYAGGNFVFFNNAGDFAMLSTNKWDYLGGARGDAAMIMNFSDGAPVVPEPASIVLLGSGIAMIGARIRRRKA